MIVRNNWFVKYLPMLNSHYFFLFLRIFCGIIISNSRRWSSPKMLKANDSYFVYKVGVSFLEGSDMLKIFCVGIGGCAGSILRYLISLYAPKIWGEHLPYGTLIVNVVGGLLIGFIMDLCLQNNVSLEIRLFLTTGIIGGFTTFSTFSYETINLFSSGRYLSASFNIGLNLFLSLGGVLLGKFICKIITHMG